MLFRWFRLCFEEFSKYELEVRIRIMNHYHIHIGYRHHTDVCHVSHIGHTAAISSVSTVQGAHVLGLYSHQSELEQVFSEGVYRSTIIYKKMRTDKEQMGGLNTTPAHLFDQCDHGFVYFLFHFGEELQPHSLVSKRLFIQHFVMFRQLFDC